MCLEVCRSSDTCINEADPSQTLGNCICLINAPSAAPMSLLQQIISRT